VIVGCISLYKKFYKKGDLTTSKMIISTHFNADFRKSNADSRR
jgi:hypothetical protein